MKKLMAVALLATLSVSALGAKVGYVNTQELFGRYSQTKVIRDNLVKEQKRLEGELQKKEIELQKLQVELQGKGDKVTEQERKDFDKKVADLKKMFQDSQLKLSQEENARMGEIERLIDISIQNVAKRDKYDYVLEQGAVKFGGDNLTSKVLEVMEKSKKVK